MTKNVAIDRAQFAFKVISELSEDNLAKYRSLVRSFPAMILNNGLGMSLAYLYAKNNSDEHSCLYGHIKRWMKRYNMPPDNKDLITYLSESDDDDKYRMVETETLALLEWLKRFAEGAGQK